MAIVSCPHNDGRMGLCSACAAEAETSVRRQSQAMARHRELHEAARLAEKHGFPSEAATLRRAAEKRS